MKYFVTGSTGFIGASLVKQLTNEGHYVRALVRSKERASEINNKNVELFQGTLFDTKVLESAINGVDGIFHLAAFAQPYAKDKTLYNKINAEATRNIFSIAQDKNVKRVVFTSTAGTFGPSWGTPVSEDTIRTHDFFNEYESTKFIAEKIAKDFVLRGLDIVIVHPTRVYGPGRLSKSNAVTLMIKKYTKGQWRVIPGSDGKKIGNYVYINDVVNGHIAAMNNGVAGQQYLLGGENKSYADFFKLLRNVSTQNYKLLKIPVWALKSFAAIQMKIALLFNHKPLLPPKWVEKYLYDWAVSSKKAEKELAYKITPLREGFTKTIEWLKSSQNAERQ
ncbi:MAG: NAD-dependent epimerase/dehydratase family protein [Bacteroidales bacterium]